MPQPITRTIIAASDELADRVDSLDFAPPVAAVYNPLRYAREVRVRYYERFATGPRRVVFLGMNPGPWGMAQTGIPFGEIDAVRKWMGLSGQVDRPDHEHPRRPVEGFACERSEVSGRRFWGLMAERFADAEEFFASHFVANYCPLVFMADTGRNITPDKLPADERAPLFRLCDEFLARLVEELRPEHLVGVGKFAAARAEAATARLADPPEVSSILHPSPASPAANRDWAGQATRQLRAIGVW